MKLATFLKTVLLLLKKPYLLHLISSSDFVFKEKFVLKYPMFKFGFPIISYQNIVENNTQISPFAYMHGGSLPTDLALLQSICKWYHNPLYFEIGTWRGESAVACAKFCKQVYTLNLSDKQMRKAKWTDDLIAQQRFYSQNNNNITHLEGDAFEFDFTEFNRKVDVVFIDGDHTYKGVLNDTKKCIELLKNEHSTIVWHDAIHESGKPRYEVILAILDALPVSMHSQLFFVKNTKCAICTNKKINFKPNNGLIELPEISYDVTLSYN